jgi:hypothetical protein
MPSLPQSSAMLTHREGLQHDADLLFGRMCRRVVLRMSRTVFSALSSMRLLACLTQSAHFVRPALTAYNSLKGTCVEARFAARAVIEDNATSSPLFFLINASRGMAFRKKRGKRCRRSREHGGFCRSCPLRARSVASDWKGGTSARLVVAERLRPRGTGSGQPRRLSGRDAARRGRYHRDASW